MKFVLGDPEIDEAKGDSDIICGQRLTIDRQRLRVALERGGLVVKRVLDDSKTVEAPSQLGILPWQRLAVERQCLN